VNPAGFARQLAAVYASGDRTPALRSLDVPALVVHGEADPLVPVAGGRATAAAIPGAELWTVAGMGHDIPRALWPELIGRIGALVDAADGVRAA
jgi:pimeloyl-ACP methyl ester carboxylesterase